MNVYRLFLAIAAAAEPFASPAHEAESLPEPTYESECPNWNPLNYACAVLCAKDSRAKFATSCRGGLHTVYVSEVLGHCPLIPGHADLIPFIDEGIQVLIAAGDPPDFRIAPRPEIRQRLRGGGLPIAITTWSDPERRLRYEEVAFVRLIGEAMEPARGDENAAAFLRLRVRNLTDREQAARLWLCINRSNNGQPRGVSSYEYGAPLHLKGDRAVNAAGRVRLLWKAPAGAGVEERLRGSVPRPQEWKGAGDRPLETAAAPEKPFNRYFATKGDESHALIKAFDKLPMTFWSPAEAPASGPVGIGLEFPEPRWLRQVFIQYEGDRHPQADGCRLEGLDGGAWRPIEDRVNDKSRAEWKEGAKASSGLGSFWEHGFEPVRARAVRLLIDRMPAGRDSPQIAEMNISYSLDDGPPGPGSRWTDTRSGDYLGNFVRFDAVVPAFGFRDLEVRVPFLPAAEEEARWLERRDFEAELQAVANYWEGQLAQGAGFELPEPIVQEVWNANLAHLFAASEIDPTNGLAITKTNVGWYEAVWASLSSSVILALDLRGLHRDAERYLEPFLQWQGTVKPPGSYASQEGFLTSADEYTWVRWASNHGWLLWALSEHYRLSGDRAWLDRVLPRLLAACDWIERERARGKAAGQGEERPPHWGLLPPGITGDGAPNAYSFFSEACAWQGIDSAAAVLREIQHPRAGELAAASSEYKRSILEAMRWASERAPPFRLRSGRLIPFVPIDLYNTWKINTGDPTWNRHPWWLDVGPLHAVDLGAVGAESELAGWMILTAEDYWLKHGLSIDEPWYAPQRAVYLGRDQIDRFLEVYYNLLAEGMDRQIYAPVEGHGGVQNLPWADGEHTRTLRRMLIAEGEDSISLAAAIPRAWLDHGRRVAVRGAPTHFGRIGFMIESDLLSQRIKARLQPPDRRPAALRLRLRHPEGKPIRAVKVNGRPHEDFGGEWIHLKPGAAALEVEAAY